MPKHFITKFTVGGGPSPLRELERISDLADSSPTCEAWFGSHKPGSDWSGAGICILLSPTLEAVIAEVVDRTNKAPDEPSATELYEGRGDFVTWWRIRNPIRVRFRSLAEIPGHNWKSGLGAAGVFGRSQVSFTYWDFDGASFEDLCARATLASRSVPNLAKPVVRATPDDTLPTIDSGGGHWARPESPLCGVDFSGGKEDQRGNRKIWVATWSPNKDVTLRCGLPEDTAEGICRRDLPELIERAPAWWSLDFPFGIAKNSARALGISTWPEWLRWCGANGDATTLRDRAKELTGRAGLSWAQPREVDESCQTTWFPLFEQLYRQTIYGAREVLLPLYEEGFCILPWGWTSLKSSRVVVEGFPGAIVRDRLLKRRVSYKGGTEAHRTARQAIIDALRSTPFAIPIPDQVGARAVDDEEGDAVDALVLLLGAWISQRLPQETWKQQCERLDSCGSTVEGWFPT